MGPDGKIIVSCRMTPEEVVEMEHLITADGFNSRNAWLRDRILEDVRIAKSFGDDAPLHPIWDR